MKLVLIISIFGMLFGCNNGLDDINEFMERQKDIPVPRIDPLPQLKPLVAFEYNANGSRDPFSNDLEVEDIVSSEEMTAYSEGGVGPDLTRRKEFLESYPLDSLLMVGTYEQEGNYWGLVVDPDGKVHPVAVGHFLGHNHGEVIGIYENEIKIVEWLNDGLGAWREREAAMALKDE